MLRRMFDSIVRNFKFVYVVFYYSIHVISRKKNVILDMVIF